MAEVPDVPEAPAAVVNEAETEAPDGSDAGEHKQLHDDSDGGGRGRKRKAAQQQVHEDTYRQWTIAGEEVQIKEPTKKRMKKLDDAQLRFLAYKHRLGELCRADNMLQALRVYDEMKEYKMPLDTGTFTVLLAVCGGNAGDRDELSSGNGDIEFNKRERDELKANGPPPGSAERNAALASQASYKIYTEDMAAASLRRIPESAFTALIRAACRAGEVDRGLELLRQLLAAPSEKPRIRSYGPLLAACAEAGRLDDSMALWKSALEHQLLLTEREYLSLLAVCTATQNRERFEDVVSNYMEDVLQPRSRQSWDVIRAWFEAEGGWTIIECDVADDGRCDCCARVLESVELSDDMTQRLLQQVADLVRVDDRHKAQWATFTDWVEEHGLGFDVIIDGANVGYFKKKSMVQVGSLVDHEQIDWVVRHFEEQGKRVLVVLHNRHLQDSKLSPQCLRVLLRWRADGIVQSCMPKNNDDWYWLWAAVRVGGRVLVVTNDEMRDHHFLMLSHRSFQQWKERHQVHFCFGDWRDSRRQVLVREPRKYSKRIQRASDDSAWHFPLEGEDRWLCVTKSGAS
eukprot:TRINITY_DN2391_c0_g1_i1.p1 TRINITY_DN2391_c0_g1~~TRINITY_DN2391_c0_g1_i1.p1  ORF type:complete len:571 (+),score=175.45 TRINITY_DN2391_c0_g1_i1:177-1889(+)